MKPDRLERIHRIFTDVLDLPAADRRDEVWRRCNGDTTIADAVSELLDEETRHHTLLDANLCDLAAAALHDPDPPGITNQRIGRYRLIRLLGEGGMGVVYLAERTDIGGYVALKILRDAWMSPMRRERFSQEQRLLAKLSHPNIARIFEAETLPDGTPWFAMEYADGRPITEYVQPRRTTVREALLLFRQVCQATQYAHRLTIVHRDLKPSNILVTQSGLVKLLDFGIAKVLDENSETERTNVGLRLMTPAYAAPEQIDGGSIGVFTDVYALGVLLREMLTGDRPLQGQLDPPSSMRRAAGLAAGRGVAATKGEWADLDVLCLTAAHRDPERRYSSVDALLVDVDAFLDGRALRARPDSFWYVAGKFARRNRLALSIGAAALAVLLIAITGFTLGLTRARNAALAEVARTNRLEHFTESLFDGGDPTTGPSLDLTAAVLLRRGQLQADGLRDDPQIQADMASTLGRAFQHLGHLDRADALLQQALDGKRKQFGTSSPQYAGALLTMGQLRKDQGRMGDSIRILRQALTLARQVYPANDPNLAPFLCSLGSVLTLRGEYPESKTLLAEAVQNARRPAKSSVALAQSLQELGEVEFYLARYPQSAALSQDALHEYRALYGPTHPSVAHVLDTLGNISQNQGHLGEAETFFRQALATDTAWYGPNHPAVAAELTSLAKVVASKKRYADAQHMLEQALAIKRATYGDLHSQVALAWNELGVLAYTTDREEDAERDFQEALSIWRKVYGDRHQFVGLGYANLAGVYLARKQYAVAEEMCRSALRIYTASLPPNHPNLAVLHVKLGRILLRQGKFAEAEPETLLGYKFFTKNESGLSSYATGSRKDLVEIEHHLKHQDILNSLGTGMRR